MSKRFTAFSPAALALGTALSVASLAAALPLPQSGELANQVSSIAASAGDMPVFELWGKALELREADDFGTEGALDRVLDDLLDEGTISPRGTLFLVACRLQGDDPDISSLSNLLKPLISSGDTEAAQGAGAILGDPIFRGLSRSTRDSLTDEMLVAARDATRSPDYRLRFAQSAYTVGSGSQRKDALQEMRTFLKSSDPELRAKGALALASTAQPIEGLLRRELERLERLPDMRGSLASAYIKRERYKETTERRLKDLAAENRSVPPELDEFNLVLEMINNMHLEGSKVTREDLVAAAMEGMLRWMDPHSSYLSSEAYSKFFQDLEAEYSGIGAYVNEDPDNGLFTIVRPIYSGPAYEAGLKTDDKIVRIDDWPTLGKPVDEIIKRLKGKPGTTAKLYIWRRGMDSELIDRPTEDMVFEVTRRKIDIPAGSSQLLPGGIGLLELSTFSRQAMAGMKEDIERMKADGMRALVLDLRYNSGGLLTQARDVADLFLDPGKLVVTTEGRGRPPEHLKTRTKALLPEGVPVVILTSRFTASASEIVSGALRDHDRATLIGKTTFGKGSVQQLIPVGVPQDEWQDTNRNGAWDNWEKITVDHDGDGEVDYAPRLKLTIARYLLPKGDSIHRELDDEGNILSMGGVEPDFVVDTPTIERWKFDEQRRLYDEGHIRDYVDKHWDANQELFGHLAVNDGLDTGLYPGFDDFYASLDTSLGTGDVRRVIREEIRRRVQDALGREFPRGDFVEDPQLQKAIEVALEELGQTTDDVAEFRPLFDVGLSERAHELAQLSGPVGADLRQARALIEDARNRPNGLSEEELDEVLRLLEKAEEN